MQMVGPYEELHKCYQSPGYLPDPEQCIQNHMRYRYYYDPPELLLCVISVRDHWHVGIYNDIPQETASICVSNDQVQKDTRKCVSEASFFVSGILNVTVIIHDESDQ